MPSEKSMCDGDERRKFFKKYYFFGGSFRQLLIVICLMITATFFPLLNFFYIFTHSQTEQSVHQCRKIRSWCCCVLCLRSKNSLKGEFVSHFFPSSSALLLRQHHLFFQRCRRVIKAGRENDFFASFDTFFYHTPKRAQAAKFKNLDYFNVKNAGLLLFYRLGKSSLFFYS